MNLKAEPLKPVFLILIVLAAAGIIFLALRLDKTGRPLQEERFLNWKHI